MSIEYRKNMIKRIEDWDVILVVDDNLEWREAKQRLIDFFKEEFGEEYIPLSKEELIKRILIGIEWGIKALNQDFLVLKKLFER